MFTVNTNRTIKMNKEDFVQFPLFINNGTRLNPVRYEFEKNDGCEVYFYILPIHGTFDDFILKKTFNTDGIITTQKQGKDPSSEQVDTIINDNKDIVIVLNNSDTSDIDPGHYIYVVRAKVLTEKINSPNIVKYNEYTELQITNRYDFYLLEDDINRAE